MGRDGFEWPPLTGCGTQHPHRALGGTCVLLAAAPTTPPCFRHWRRSSSLLSIFSGKNIYNFAILENLRIFQNCLFTGGDFSIAAACLHPHPSAHCVRIHLPPTGGRLLLRQAFSPYTVKRGCCAKCCATAPVVLCYIFSGTLILNMVSTLKMTFFTPMHRARRACCTAGSAP